MNEIESNKTAWGMISGDHYEYFKKLFAEKDSSLNSIIENELGDVCGKKVIHIHCNTGADTISLARKGAIVTGVDLVPENIFYAKKLSAEMGIKNIDFFESDTMELKEKHHKKYDLVFATEGILYWLPELKKWAETVKHLLNENGVLFLSDYHPFYFVFDEKQLKENKLNLDCPYFNRKPLYSEFIGGYASEKKKCTNYGWMYTISDIINPLAKAGLTIEYINEFDRIPWDLGGMGKDESGLYYYPFFEKKIPLLFSLKARSLPDS